MKKLILFSIISLIFISCETKEQRFERIKACRYVFYDSGKIMHLDENCSVLNSDKYHIKERREKYSLIYITNLNEYNCSKCITDEDFIELEKEIQHYKQIQNMPY